MNTNRTFIAAAAIALIANLPLAGLAQTSGDPHHPADQAPAQQAAQAPAPGRPMPGNMGPGNMGIGQMPMMDMATMMQMMGAMQPGMMGGMGMAMTDHVEGRIAFLKAELKITDAQTGPWNTFADTLRANAKKFGDARQSMMKPGAARASFAESLDLQERLLSARLDGTRSMKAAFAALVPKLSDEQKKAADDLLAPPFGMGMMAMGGMAGAR